MADLFKKLNRKVIAALAAFVIAVLSFGTYQYFYLKKAHSTFENYYAFRGCTQLLSKTDDYGLCKIKSGETIKIVKYKGKWYLDGDLPTGFPSW